jgi:hypothetical protein
VAAHLTEDEPSESHYFPVLMAGFRVKDAEGCSNTFAYALMRFLSHANALAVGQGIKKLSALLALIDALSVKAPPNPFRLVWLHPRTNTYEL